MGYDPYPGFSCGEGIHPKRYTVEGRPREVGVNRVSIGTRFLACSRRHAPGTRTALGMYDFSDLSGSSKCELPVATTRRREVVGKVTPLFREVLANPLSGISSWALACRAIPTLPELR